MPVRLSTTLSKISSIPNGVNGKFLEEFHLFMKKNHCSESHRNNTLKTSMAFANFLGPGKSFCEVTTKDDIIAFLDTKIKDVQEDPDRRWITTWNDYLGSTCSDGFTTSTFCLIDGYNRQ